MKNPDKKEKNNNPFSEENPEGVVVEHSEDDTSNVEEPAGVEDTANVSERLNELNNQYIRLAADFDNYRKRHEQERESLLKFGTQEALKKMLNVLDNFDRAEKTLADSQDVEKIKEAFYILKNQTIDELKKMGLEQIEAQGKEFDPNMHEAVMQTPSEEYEDNHIIAELQKGYKFNDKVLRASLVNVAKN